MIEYLSGFMLPGREKVLRETLANRTRYMTICLENTYHPQNASALVRNCEAFGIQDIHTVETVCRFTPNANIVRGTDKWVDIRKHPDTPSLVGDLRARGYRIVATSPHADDRTPETFDVEAGPFALFFGTEHAGISEEVVAAADEFVRIPMCGFVESLNVSASAAILLYLLWLPVAGIPARCFRGPVAVACRSPFPVAGHASCKRFSTGRSEKKPRKMGYSQFLATFATRKCGSSPR